MWRIISLTLLVILCIGCKNNQKETTTGTDVLMNIMDTTIAPGSDFFSYANGGWIKKNPIPAEQSSWGIGHLVMEENMKRLRELCEKSAKLNAKKGTTDQKIGDFWTIAMDSIKLEVDGLTHLQPFLNQIDSCKNLNELFTLTTSFRMMGSSTFFSDYIYQDSKNSSQMAYYLNQGGLGLPEREYYFKNDSSTKSIRTNYLTHIQKMLTLSGVSPEIASNAAENILNMETEMANASRKIEDLRDPYKNYNKLAITDVQRLCPSVNWHQFFEKQEILSIDSVIIGQPEFFKSLDQTIKKTDLSNLKLYVRYHAVQDWSAFLPDKFGIASFEFNKQFSGATVRRPRWKRSMVMIENAMGELLGQLYVKEFFNENAKKRYTVMVDAIKDALRDRIENLAWMSDTTKKKALVKLTSIKSKIGYPNKWKDFSSLEVGKISLLQNYIQSRLFWHQYEVNKLGKPVDRENWDMTPQTYNAYYNPSNNEIVLPAGIFTVPGYRDEELDDAVAYGYAGASTIGHEITHGFDDQGRQFDEQGNLKNWWTASDEKAFSIKAARMIEQFNSYEPLPGYKINGSATLGENIADLGAVILGFEAFKKTQQYKDNKPIAGLTPAERYYIGYSMGWMGHTREELQKNLILTDVHSPEKYRVNGIVNNTDAFYEIFKINPKDKLYLPDSLRVRIW